MSGKKKLSFRIFLRIFIGSILVFSLYAYVNFVYAKNHLISLTTRLVEKTFRSAYNQVESQILPVLNHASNTCFSLTQFPASTESLIAILDNTHATFPYILGSGIEVEDKSTRKKQSIYLNQLSQNIGSLNTGSLDLNFDSNDYRIFFREDTTSICFFRATGKYKILLRYDFPVNLFINTLNRETRQLQSQHYLFDENNQPLHFAASRNKRSVTEQQQEIEYIKKYLKENRYGFFTYPDFLKNHAVFISKLRGTDYIMASTMRTDEVVKHFQKFYRLAFFLGLFAVLILAYILQFFIMRTTRPLRELSALSKSIEKGNLHTVIPEDSQDLETQQLSKTLRTIQERMQRHISGYKTVLKEKRAMEKDLSFAEKIQYDMLPKSDRILRETGEIDGFCLFRPAKGVAGDFYDYMMIDPERLFFVLGDVSGKSIPAALFMVKTITLIQGEARKGKSPGEVFEAVNTELNFRNEEGMFVTAVCGLINIKTGECVLCDAGHNTPLTAMSSPGFSYHELNKNTPLGIIEGLKYKETLLKFGVNDTLILYTDGLPEANSATGKMLGYEAIEETLKLSAKKEVSIIVNNLMNLYEQFITDTPPSDDVTLFILRYTGQQTA